MSLPTRPLTSDEIAAFIKGCDDPNGIVARIVRGEDMIPFLIPARSLPDPSRPLRLGRQPERWRRTAQE